MAPPLHNISAVRPLDRSIVLPGSLPCYAKGPQTLLNAADWLALGAETNWERSRLQEDEGSGEADGEERVITVQ